MRKTSCLSLSQVAVDKTQKAQQLLPTKAQNCLRFAGSTTGSPSAICVGSGFRGHLVEFGRNILELLVYYLMLNKCKNLKDMKSSCLSVCTSSLYDNEGRYFLHYYM